MTAALLYWIPVFKRSKRAAFWIPDGEKSIGIWFEPDVNTHEKQNEERQPCEEPDLTQAIF
jgi:hypothetical protein